jgi:hypothetical protein
VQRQTSRQAAHVGLGIGVAGGGAVGGTEPTRSVVSIGSPPGHGATVMRARVVPQDDKDAGWPRCRANRLQGGRQDAYDCLSDGSVVCRLSVKIRGG